MARQFIEIDDRELHELAVDISGAPGRLQRNARDATVKGLRLLNKVMKADATGHRYLKGLPKSVSYQLVTDLTGDVGMSPGGQGSLAHIVIHGSVNNAPIYDYTRGPRMVQPEIDGIYADAAEDAVFGGAR